MSIFKKLKKAFGHQKTTLNKADKKSTDSKTSNSELDNRKVTADELNDSGQDHQHPITKQIMAWTKENDWHFIHQPPKKMATYII